MALVQRDRVRDEKINGVIFDMSPSPRHEHSIINGNLYAIIKAGLKDSICKVFYGDIDYVYNPNSDDYLEPDIIICCDKNQIRGNSYYGTPKFVAEIISPSTAKRDKTIKKDIYEKAGVEEYWIISPIERALEIYHLKNGRYELVEMYVVEDDEKSEHYNIKTEVTLRCFPITMTLEEIFAI